MKHVEDEASHQHPKRSKPTNQAQLKSTSAKESILETPILPAELITEILLRLPVKPLLKFRSVSKSWLALISSPEFVKAHLSLSANNKDYTHHRLVLTQRKNVSSTAFERVYQYNLKDCSLSSILNESVTEIFDLDYPMNNANKHVRIAGSVNGLICLSIGKDLCIWNPSIRKFKKLPDSISTISGYTFSFIYGFGYDESHDDYKIVGIIYFYRGASMDHVEVKIYSLKRDSWRSEDDFPDGLVYASRGTFVNRKLHWINYPLHAHRKGWSITSFDLADEKWGKLEQPHYGGGDRLQLGVLGSDLSVFCSNISRTHIDMWIMKEYGVKESWSKMFTIKHPQNLLNTIFTPSYLLSNKGEILVVLGLTFMIYNPKDGSYRHSEVSNDADFHVAAFYFESLVCPFSTEGAEDATKETVDKAQIKTIDN